MTFFIFTWKSPFHLVCFIKPVPMHVHAVYARDMRAHRCDLCVRAWAVAEQRLCNVAVHDDDRGGSDVISREISGIERQRKAWNSFTGVEALLHQLTFTSVSFLENCSWKNRRNIYFSHITWELKCLVHSQIWAWQLIMGLINDELSQTIKSGWVISMILGLTDLF